MTQSAASIEPKFVVPRMEVFMRATIDLDDELLAKAQAYTGLEEHSKLIHEALKALIERESARRLVKLAGTERV
jgi:Arc/MetJ family transcription regulator